MSGYMTPISFGPLMEWVISEYKNSGSVFSQNKFYKAAGSALTMFGRGLETPVGPAAGPHTQLSQNLVAAYVCGARFFELKTVQTLDGEDLPVAKPCILAQDEGYNVEWSTELRVPDAMSEYVNAYLAITALSRMLGLGAPDGFIFNMSVGYDLEGIKSPKIDAFIEGMKNASGTDAWKQGIAWLSANSSRLGLDEAFINAMSPNICNSITLSTLHGCPPQEIERIASYLITVKKLNTYIKCNPTLLGYEFARRTMDAMGYDYLAFDEHHFKNDLQFEDAVPMMTRLQKLADGNGLWFGVKLTNTFPVKIASNELPGEEMYMSGRALFPLSISLAFKLAAAFGGALRISFSGGADHHNIRQIIEAGIYPVTLATTLLKPGGYGRLRQIARNTEGCVYAGVNLAKLENLAQSAVASTRYAKPIKPPPIRRSKGAAPLLYCYGAPCSSACPIGQDASEYVHLYGEGRKREALELIVKKNPLPFMTGTICNHRCMAACTRGFYEDPIAIRAVKLAAAKDAFGSVLAQAKPGGAIKCSVAVVGAGPAGLSAAYFAAKHGARVTVYEKRECAGGIPMHMIPEFRIGKQAVQNDVELVKAMGVRFVFKKEAPPVGELAGQYDYVFLGIGAHQPGVMPLEGDAALNVLEYLESEKLGNARLGKHVAVVGAGNSAMDAARAAKRHPGVETVRIVYRRTIRQMPADLEELELAKADGVELLELLAPVSFKNGGLKCEVMRLGEPDESGRRSPRGTGEYRSVAADTVIAAVGERVDGAYLAANGLEMDKRGPVADARTCETNLPGVFIGGDARRGPATIVEAIADGMAFAREIILREGARPDFDSKYTWDMAIVSQRGVLEGVKPQEQERERCLACGQVCNVCVESCPNRAYTLIQSGRASQVLRIEKMCNECGNCASFCPHDGNPYKDKFTLFHTEKEFKDSTNSGFVQVAPGKFTVRLEGREYDSASPELQKPIADLVGAIASGYAHLLAL